MGLGPGRIILGRCDSWDTSDVERGDDPGEAADFNDNIAAIAASSSAIRFSSGCIRGMVSISTGFFVGDGELGSARDVCSDELREIIAGGRGRCVSSKER